MIFTDDLEQCR